MGDWMQIEWYQYGMNGDSHLGGFTGNFYRCTFRRPLALHPAAVAHFVHEAAAGDRRVATECIYISIILVLAVLVSG